MQTIRGHDNKEAELNKSSFVLEIASNDGYLLQFFKDKEIPVSEIDRPRQRRAQPWKKEFQQTFVFLMCPIRANLRIPAAKQI